MTGMRKATVKLSVVCGAAAVAAAGLMAPVASAAPAGHEVRYTLSVGGPATFDLRYLVNQPANKAAYNADAYAYPCASACAHAGWLQDVRRMVADQQ